ncbi:unnamed protein product [Mytilus coruscus]|uniref:DNA-directed DNA polymerase family B exonuclease domain-containing protein n=1 Tax=Mytilus coruscus TaxID=42192 RepID=A0A6J8ER80_MYTCO|nr:unnamed protein product [Mytilus coruscus]
MRIVKSTWRLDMNRQLYIVHQKDNENSTLSGPSSEPNNSNIYEVQVTDDEQHTNEIKTISRTEELLEDSTSANDALSAMSYMVVGLQASKSTRNSHITQISATSDKGSLNTCILPKKPITPKAQEITGIKVEGSKMFCHDKEVKSVSIREALKIFLQFLAQYKENVIIGHKIKSYDIPVLFCALNYCSIMNEFSCSILGFLDTLQLFKSLLPGLTLYSQSYFVQYSIK